MNKLTIISIIILVSLLLGGCTLLGNKQESISTVNSTLLITPTPNVVASPIPAQPEDEVKLSSDNELDSIDADLDMLENLENVGLD